MTHLASTTTLLALAGCTALTTAVSANIVTSFTHPFQYSVNVTNMPDIDQRRKHDDRGTPWDFSDDIVGLPNDGEMYCAPTAAMNLFIYAANHGFPGLAPGPGTWGSPSEYNFASLNLLNLGVLMGTHPVSGTKGGVRDGIIDWLKASNDLGDFLLLTKKRSGTVFPRAEQIATMARLGGISMFCYGRYDACCADFLQYPLVGRDGGHCVTFTGYTRNGTNQELRYRDPASDKEWKTWQSGWANSVQPVTDIFVWTGMAPFGGLAHVSAINHPSDDGKIRIIDAVYTLMPRFGLSYKNVPGQAKSSTRKTTPVSWPTSEPSGAGGANGADVQLSVNGTIAGWAPKPYTAETWSLITPAAGQPAVLHATDLLSGEAVPLPLAPTGLNHLAAGRFEELFAVDGSTLFRLDAEGNVLASVPMPGIAALAYDDQTDHVLALSVANGVIWRVDRSLTGPPTPMAIPTSIPLSGKGDLVADTVDAGRVWFISQASNSVFGLKPFGPALDLSIISLPAVQSPTDLEMDEQGRMYAVCNGVVVALKRFPGIGWLVDASAAMHGQEVGAGLVIGRTRSNFDPADFDGPEWRNLDHDLLGDFPEVPDCFGDLTFDGMVDGSDVGLLLADWGQPGPGDLDGSGVIDASDLGLLLSAWGGCGG